MNKNHPPVFAAYPVVTGVNEPPLKIRRPGADRVGAAALSL